MTGRYPARLHLTDWIAGHKRPWAKLSVPKFNQQLPHEEVTLAKALKPAGYVSASIGKWHLGDKPYYPQDQGFDVNFAGTRWGAPRRYFHPYKEWTCDAHRPGEYLTDRLTDEAEAFIEQNGQWERAARELFCHRHTLRYRIRRIEQLTGRDLSGARDRIEFWLALRARELVS